MEVASYSEGEVKRAGFKVGIGRELYSSPFIWLSVETEQDKNGRWQLADRFAKFDVAEIDYDQNRKINRLRIIDVKTGKNVYEYGLKNKQTQNKQASETKKTDKPANATNQEAKKESQTNAPQQAQNTVAQSTNATTPKSNVVVTTSATVPNPGEPQYLNLCRAFLNKHKITREKFTELVNTARKDSKKITEKKFNELSETEWIELLGALESLITEGYFKDVA